jgi:predicted DNA-binding protein (MmcQ/YjbR family)
VTPSVFSLECYALLRSLVCCPALAKNGHPERSEGAAFSQLVPPRDHAANPRVDLESLQGRGIAAPYLGNRRRAWRASLVFKSPVAKFQLSVCNLQSRHCHFRCSIMNVDWVRKTCLSFPGAFEQVVWEGDLTFKVAGKMFAHTVLEVAPVWLSFKTSHENFAELTERSGIVPAPYLARAQWIALETRDALPLDELARLLRESYDLVVSKLPAKTRKNLISSPHLPKSKPTHTLARHIRSTKRSRKHKRKPK